ncbi:1-acyl-sn-glycerol-3-phosphate acyltransferase [Rhodobacter ferrooxidans]|uniref:Glycerol-3-phosphate acyltransferase n=1 Tax=Rhodobacter ferrooxidans TaxID=371731 RepID=C8S3A8_9RHOB|nr:1-acyl-sn-glycerol-3-phosphate acyltransferase [Rhodobacter sp. SW2]EEW24473.1 phospholipid/glycerol acyltransferase [Rhodobacter sp. SW2]
MTTTVTLPLWLVVLALILAAIATLDRVLMPSARWFLRRRMMRLVARLNKRLDRPIEPFKLMARQDMIVRLVHDPRVMEAVVEHARETGAPESVAFQLARTYAREIVPGFSALVYFGFATRAARRISRAFYRVRIGKVDAALADIDRSATVIFVMNHRSNMDYVLVTWLVADRGALSYAVGEWARIWPLSRLIRAMGAYFIRRKSSNPLYRRVLARYVQMATAEGATQAVFPEGGLSLDGRVGAARLGLLGYIVNGFDPAGRDVVFVPVAIAYDRVLEDRLLVEAGQSGVRQFRGSASSIAGFIGRMGWRLVRGRFPGFGTAAVAFGAPISLRGYLAGAGASTEGLGALLMAEVAQSVPILPVPLVAAALAAGPVPRADLPGRLTALIARLQALGAVLKLPPTGLAATLAEGLRPLEARGIVVEAEAGLQPAPSKAALFAFYAAPVLQRLEIGVETQPMPTAEVD